MYTAGPNAFFSGSANVPYKPSKKPDPGVGFSMFQSITAMKEYENISNEEIRLEDYNAACGLFGCKIANLGMALCVEPKNKLRPYEYGVLFQEALSSYIEKHGIKQEYDKFNRLLRPSLAPASAFKLQNERKHRICASPSKNQYTKIVVIGSGVNVNVNVFKSDSTIKEDGQPTKLASPVCDPAMKKVHSNLSDSESTSKTKTLSPVKTRKESCKESKREGKTNLKSDRTSSPSQQINPTHHEKFGRGLRTSNGNSSKRNRKY